MARTHVLAGAGIALVPLFGMDLTAQARWSPFATATDPTRWGVGAAYDAAGQRLLYVSFDSPSRVAEVWAFDGTDWSLLPGANPPTGWIDAGMATWDSDRRRLVLFTNRNETWEWDGSAWEDRTPATGPGDRQNPAMTYDSVRQEVLLFGGYDPALATGSEYMNDLWAWDGSAWTLRATGGPIGRSWAAMAFDPDRGVAVMHGGWFTFQIYVFPVGLQTQAATQFDTWEWDGSRWTAKGTGPQRKAQAMAYDSARRRIVMFGGSDNRDFRNDTYEYDGTGWDFRYTGPPGARNEPVMAYDAGRSRMVMLGGYHSFDAWEYYTEEPASQSAFGSGCVGSNGTPQLTASALAWIGGELAVEVSNLPAPEVGVVALGASDTLWGTVGLPFGLGLVGAPTCSLLVSLDAFASLAITAGTGSWSVPIPADPAFAGVPFYLQGLALDSGGTSPTVVVSNGLAVTIGIP
ncbi:MAG: hypothetical protein AAF628_24025 [Planctomycetota bacterium]